MSALFDAARDLQTYLETRGWGFCFIGGLAVLRWGEPRFTRDVDVTLLCPFGSEDDVSAPLLDSGYLGRIADAREFARRNRVLLLQSPDGVPVAIALAALPFEEGLVEPVQLLRIRGGVRLANLPGGGPARPQALRVPATRCAGCGDDRNPPARLCGLAVYRDESQPLAEVKDQPEIMTTFEKLKRAR
jgi:hypothetical protein